MKDLIQSSQSGSRSVTRKGCGIEIRTPQLACPNRPSNDDIRRVGFLHRTSPLFIQVEGSTMYRRKLRIVPHFRSRTLNFRRTRAITSISVASRSFNKLDIMGIESNRNSEAPAPVGPGFIGVTGVIGVIGVKGVIGVQVAPDILLPHELDVNVA